MPSISSYQWLLSNSIYDTSSTIIIFEDLRHYLLHCHLHDLVEQFDCLNIMQLQVITNHAYGTNNFCS